MNGYSSGLYVWSVEYYKLNFVRFASNGFRFASELNKIHDFYYKIKFIY